MSIGNNRKVCNHLRRAFHVDVASNARIFENSESIDHIESARLFLKVVGLPLPAWTPSHFEVKPRGFDIEDAFSESIVRRFKSIAYVLEPMIELLCAVEYAMIQVIQSRQGKERGKEGVNRYEGSRSDAGNMGRI